MSEEAIAAREALASEIAGRLAQAMSDQGYTATAVQTSKTDTGNGEAVFEATVAGDVVSVYVTSCSTADMAEKTFEANCTDEEGQNMAVMNEWTANGNTVRVVRNNRANRNYIEILATKQKSAIHIQDELPEQLDPVLQVVQAAGYPVSES